MRLVSTMAMDDLSTRVKCHFERVYCRDSKGVETFISIILFFFVDCLMFELQSYLACVGHAVQPLRTIASPHPAGVAAMDVSSDSQYLVRAEYQ